MTVVSDNGTANLAAELEALSARVDMAKADAAERALAIATAVPPSPMPEPSPPGGGSTGRSRSPRKLILALGLVLLAVVAVIVASDGPDTRVPGHEARPGSGIAASQPVPTTVAGPPATPNPVGPPPVAVQDAPPPPAVLVPPAVAPPTMPEATTTVDVVVGDSFWSIAERRVAFVSGDAATTAEVASYWAELVEANQGRLAHAGHSDLIYPGQTFSLP